MPLLSPTPSTGSRQLSSASWHTQKSVHSIQCSLGSFTTLAAAAAPLLLLLLLLARRRGRPQKRQLVLHPFSLREASSSRLMREGGLSGTAEPA
jgi:hypothetical protein